MNAVILLETSGLTVASQAMAPQPADGVFSVEVDGIEFTLAIERRARAPYPNELPTLEPRRLTLTDIGVPTLISQYISEPTGHALTEAGWSWIDGSGNADIRGPGVRVQRRTSMGPPKRSPRRLPASWSVIRELIESNVSAGVTRLAERAGVSQPRTSQVLAQLADLGFVDKTGRSAWTTDRAALLDAFLDEYRGPGGVDRWWYSLDAPATVAERLLDAHPDGLMSGDVAADRLAPWSTPTSLTFYAFSPVDIPSGLVEAEGPGDGNVHIIHPEDLTVRPAPPLPAGLARPTQVIWDLRRDGDDTRRSAADRVAEWMLAQ